MASALSIARPIRWVPPEGARLEPGHPLSKSQIFCYIPSTGFTDLATGIQGTNNGVTKGSSPYGDGGLSSANSNYASFAGISDTPFLGPLTLEWIGTLRVGSRFHHFMGKHAGNGGTNNPFDFRTDNSATPKIVLLRADGSSAPAIAASSLAVGALHHIIVTIASGALNASQSFYVDGAFDQTRSNANAGSVTGSGANLVVGQRPDGTTVSLDGVCVAARAWNRVLTGAEIFELFEDPFHYIEAPVRRYIAAGKAQAGSSVAGTISWTEGNDTWTAAGSETIPGSISWSEGNDTWTAAGAEAIAGTAAWTEGNDTWSAAGAESIVGALAWTESNDTWAISSSSSIAGTLAWTESNDIWLFSSLVAESVNSTTWRGPRLTSSTWKHTQGY